MRRPRSYPCPTPGCHGERRFHQAVCPACWTRLPADLRERIHAARRRRAPHLEAQAAIVATNWLIAHAPAVAIARQLGERSGEARPP